MKQLIVFLMCSGLICFIPINGVFASVPVTNQTSVTIIPLQSTGVISVTASEERKMTVQYDIRENQLFVECLINGFLFSEEKAGTQHKEGEGHLRLYIDEEHIDTLYQPAFIVEGLSKGKHDIKVIIVKNDRTPYELEETFQVHI